MRSRARSEPRTRLGEVDGVVSEPHLSPTIRKARTSYPGAGEAWRSSRPQCSSLQSPERNPVIPSRSTGIDWQVNKPELSTVIRNLGARYAVGGISQREPKTKYANYQLVCRSRLDRSRDCAASVDRRRAEHRRCQYNSSHSLVSNLILKLSFTATVGILASASNNKMFGCERNKTEASLHSSHCVESDVRSAYPRTSCANTVATSRRRSQSSDRSRPRDVARGLPSFHEKEGWRT